MEISTTEDGVYRLYTIINNTNKPVFDNRELHLQDGVYEVGDDSSVVFVTLPQEEEEEEEQIDTTMMTNSLLTTEEGEPVSEPTSTEKVITLEIGSLNVESDTYLAAENSPDDQLTAVEPRLLTDMSEESEAVDNLQAAYGENLENTAVAEQSADFHEVQLEDGTCAIINASLWNSLLENAPVEVQPELVKKKSFPCLYVGCGKTFTTAHHLSVHTRNHTGNRPYVCSIKGCNKAFATGYSLKAHLRTHTGEKPYGCQMCMKHFKTSGDLQKHVRTHTGEKPFKCPIGGCDKCFTTSNILKVHIRSHTGERPYKCKVPNCGKAFASATNYKNHMRIHSGEKPYACPVEGCDKRFTEYSSLYKHNAVHQPYKIYRCNYCNQFFKFENTLKLHKKTVHSVMITEDGTEFLLSDEDAKSIILELSGMQVINPALVIKGEENNSDEDNLEV